MPKNNVPREKITKLVFGENLKDFVAIVQSISSMLDEVTMKVDKRGLHFSCTDRYKQVLLVADMPASGFEEFTIPKDGEMAIHFDVKALLGIIRKMKKKDTLSLKLTRIQKIRVPEYIFQATVSNERISKEYTIWSSIPEELQKVPNIPLPGIAKLKASELLDYLIEMKTYGERVWISITDSKFTLKNTGYGDNGLMISVNAEVGGPAISAEYTIANLLYAKPLLKHFEDVTVRMGQDYPILLEMRSDYAEVQFYCAPYITD